VIDIPDNKAAIQAAQLRQLLSLSNMSLIASFTLAVILAYMMREVVSPAVLLAWCSVMVLALLARAVLIIVYQRSPVDDAAAIHVRLGRFRLVVLAAGAVWGSAGFLLFPVGDPQHQMFLVFMLAGMTAGGVVSFSVDLFSAIAFSIAVAVPLAIRLFAVGGGLPLAMGIAVVLYLGFMIINIWRINRSMYENITLHLEAAAREEAVRASEERYRLLLNHSPIGIFHYDTNLINTYCNDRLACILNSTPERIIGLDLKALRDQSIMPALKTALEGGTGHYEGRYVATYSDADRWLDMTFAPFRDGRGNIVGGIAITQDITERKQIDSELRIAAAAFMANEGIVITDAEGVILRVNQAFTSSTGYTAEEAVGKTPRMLKSGRHDAEFYRKMWEAILFTGTWQVEIWDRRKNGEIYPKWLTITAVNGESGIVTHYVGSHIDITELKAAEEAIRNLAFYDALTKLPNRRLLTDRLGHALAASARSGREGALLFIDLDNFKALNDTLGHAIGDLLLQQVAQRLTSCVREGDTVARLGGDEFVVMLENLGGQPIEAAAQAEAAGKKILAALSQPYRLAIYECHSTPSIGVTIFDAHRDSIDELMKMADIAMYQAKKAGRNTLRFFDPQMQEIIHARASLEGELRRAIENRQFELHYQVQVDDANRPIGAEALIRWQHPDHGFVPPAQFIPLAEEAGLIHAIGQWVLETACAQIKAWQQDPRARDLVLAVNISAKQLRQADFVEQVVAVIRRHAIDPKLLKLELTESLLIENMRDSIVTMSALKEIGVQFALDDFGTGYSSLQYLKQLPLDQLKIDQSFVQDISTDSHSRSIVRTVIAMAQIMGLDVIAEGVETEAQRQFLLSMECSQFQGYLFGRPVPVAQFDASLERGRSLPVPGR
jgi:diguanylate cyclase (GGDEF)-like protein/PAS domain S-box-containing protein